MSPKTIPCAYCARLFSPRRPHQRFCDSFCKNSWHNTERKEATLGELQVLRDQIKELGEEIDKLQAQLAAEKRKSGTWQHELAGTSHKPEAPSAYSKEFIREIVDGDG